MVDALLGLQSLLVNAKVDVEPQLGQLLAAVKVSAAVSHGRHLSWSVLMSVRIGFGIGQGQCGCQSGSASVKVSADVSQGHCWHWSRSWLVVGSVKVSVAVSHGWC